MRVHLQWRVNHALLVRCSRHKRHSVWQATQVLSAVCNEHNANIKCIHLFSVLLSTQWTIEFTEYKMHINYLFGVLPSAMHKRMYRVQNAYICSAYCCLRNGQSNVQSKKMHAFIQRIAVYTMDNRMYRVQNAHILFSMLLSAMDNRTYRIQNTHVYSAYCYMQWTTECTEYKMHIFIQRVTVCNGQPNALNTKCMHFIQCIAVCNG